MPFLDCGFGGADIESAINLRRIAGHDFAAKTPRQGNRERGLTGGRRSHDGDQMSHWKFTAELFLARLVRPGWSGSIGAGQGPRASPTW